MIPFNDYKNKKKKIQFTHQFDKPNKEFINLLDRFNEELRRIPQNYHNSFGPIDYTSWLDFGDILESDH